MVTTLGCLLMNLWPEFDNFLKTRGVLQRGYQGRGWDGNSSNQILKCLDEEENVVLSEVPGLFPIVHILLCHVQPFVECHNCGLSRFAEQCGESIHSKFKPTWNRFKRQEENKDHGGRLLSSVIDFNGRRVNR